MKRENLGRLDSVLAAQHGVITRMQALEAGISVDALDWRTRRDGPWQRLLPGTYAAFTGPVNDAHRLQAALLYGVTVRCSPVCPRSCCMNSPTPRPG